MEGLLNNVEIHDWNLLSFLTKDVIITYEVVIFSLCSIFPKGAHKDTFNVFFPFFSDIKHNVLTEPGKPFTI